MGSGSPTGSRWSAARVQGSAERSPSRSPRRAPASWPGDVDPATPEKLTAEASIAVAGDSAEESTADRMVAAALGLGGRVSGYEAPAREQ